MDHHQKRDYANDLNHPETLIAVDDGSNSSKSDKSPDQWMPPNVGYHCTYAIEWVDIKATWALTVTTPRTNQADLHYEQLLTDDAIQKLNRRLG